MFGKEKYSREAFEEAQKREQNAYGIASDEVRDLKERAHNVRETARHGGGEMDPDDLWEEAKAMDKKAGEISPEKIRAEARKKLDALMKAGHKDALKLNKEFDELSARAIKLQGEAGLAQINLEEFEREELGMRFEGTENETEGRGMLEEIVSRFKQEEANDREEEPNSYKGGEKLWDHFTSASEFWGDIPRSRWGDPGLLQEEFARLEREGEPHSAKARQKFYQKMFLFAWDELQAGSSFESVGTLPRNVMLREAATRLELPQGAKEELEKLLRGAGQKRAKTQT